MDRMIIKRRKKQKVRKQNLEAIGEIFEALHKLRP